MSSYVFPLDSRRALNVEHSGGKAAILARLAQLGFAVPPGCVISSSLFDGLERRCGCGGSGRGRDRERDFRDGLYRRLLECPLSDAERDSLLDAYRRFGGPVAVRSSFAGEEGL